MIELLIVFIVSYFMFHVILRNSILRNVSCPAIGDALNPLWNPHNREKKAKIHKKQIYLPRWPLMAQPFKTCLETAEDSHNNDALTTTFKYIG